MHEVAHNEAQIGGLEHFQPQTDIAELRGPRAAKRFIHQGSGGRGPRWGTIGDLRQALYTAELAMKTRKPKV